MTNPHADEVLDLFERHRAGLLRYLLTFRIAAPDAEEIVQEVFVALFEHLRRGRSRANLDGWLFRVAHNLALKRYARARRETPAETEERADLAPDPEARFAEAERQGRLLAVVRAMPETDRWCLFLRAEGLPYRDIAETLGISLGAVANSLERSLSRLSRADRISCVVR